MEFGLEVTADVESEWIVPLWVEEERNRLMAQQREARLLFY